jgi:tetratricopeptide (TPR) repeat protein
MSPRSPTRKERHVDRIARIASVAIIGVAVFMLAGLGVFRTMDRESDPDQAARGALARTADLLTPAVTPGGGLDRTIANLQARLTEDPTDPVSYASLGLAYVQQAHLTSDPSYYQKAQGALRRSLSLQPQDNEEALVGMAALAAARHDFAAALRFGDRALAIDPSDPDVYGVIGDAELELGRYDAAFATFQTMVDTRPDLASYARVSYARELQGDVDGAIASMIAARDVAGTPGGIAWTSYQIGELRFKAGDVARARSEYALGFEADPGYVANLAGLGKVAWARGDVAGAIETYTEVVQRFPAPEHVIALGDLFALAGDGEAARRQYDLVRAEEQLFAANGVNTDLELSLFNADHGDPRTALRAAKAEWERRQSVHVADALAWALHANGRDAEAARFAERALALGTRNAVFVFHAGMIQVALGNHPEGRELLREALAIDPNISIAYGPVARGTLDRIGVAR